MLIIVCGLPGSGKTTLAKALALRLGAEHLSSDVIRKEMFGRPGYSEKEKEAVYREMAARAGRKLSEGRNVVADATFYRKWQRGLFLGLPGKKITVLCTLEEEQARKRLEGRKPGGASEADYGVYRKLKAEFEPLSEKHVVVDCMAPLKERVEAVLLGAVE